jgi:predicted ATPase
MAQGVLILHDGEFEGACEQLEKGLALYRPHDHRVYVTHSSIDPGVTSLSRLSWTLWFLGYPQQALTRSRETLTLARKLGHANSLGMACNFAALLHQWCRDGQAVYEQVQAATALATEYALYIRQVRANIMAGWCLVHHGQGNAGIAQMQQGLTDYAATGTTLYREWYLALLAEVYGDDGQISIALDTLAEAMAVARDLRVSCWEPEFNRLKGQLLLQQSPDNATEAESCFQQAISIAQNQSAKSWELRAATSLARLWQSQGKRDEARELLEPVYSWFTEGFDTADLIDAKTLLDELA